MRCESYFCIAIFTNNHESKPCKLLTTATLQNMGTEKAEILDIPEFLNVVRGSNLHEKLY